MLGATSNLGTCCCVQSKWRGRGKKLNQCESSPIQQGEGTSTLRQGYISGRAFSLSGCKKISLLSSLCDAFWECTDVFASLCMQQVNWKVCLSYKYGQHSFPSHLLQERWHFFLFLISSFIPFFSSPKTSPRLPSSHPNQRTRRPLLGTPCPGNPPCTARYLWIRKGG